MSEERGMLITEGEQGRKVRKGATAWTDKIGCAEVDYVLGHPVRFRNATTPDGGTVEEGRFLSPFERDIWRCPDGRGGFSIGSLEILPDAVVFTHDAALESRIKADPSVEPRTEMQRDLALDPEFMIRIQDDPFADEVYASFCNREWRRGDGERHSISWRTSGGLVADLRRRGEVYTDWYPYKGDTDPTLAAEVEACYARLGWTRLTPEEAVSDHDAAVRLVDEIEARPEGDPWPPAGFLQPLPDDGRTDPMSRLFRARRSGRVHDAEYHRVCQRLLWVDATRNAVDDEK